VKRDPGRTTVSSSLGSYGARLLAGCRRATAVQRIRRQSGSLPPCSRNASHCFPGIQAGDESDLNGARGQNNLRRTPRVRITGGVGIFSGKEATMKPMDEFSTQRASMTATLLCGVCLYLCQAQPASGIEKSFASTNRPAEPVRLIFLHHSTGQNWLADDQGGLGVALRDNNYFVSDSNYGWGPDGIGDNTDIGDWWLWFRGPDSAKYLNAVYAEDNQNCDYSRMGSSPGGENQVVMFKSCFPNSGLRGSPGDPIPAIADNPLRGQDAGSEYHTVANAKGIYLDLLDYFRTRPDRLFVVITAPPLSEPTYAGNARALNEWLLWEWRKDYVVGNVFVFDFYNVLTSNGGDPNTNDAGRETGNHHRWWNGAVQHKSDDGSDVSAYPSSSSDDHPSPAGSKKATIEFVPLLNGALGAWRAIQRPVPAITAIQVNPPRVELALANLVAGGTYHVERSPGLPASGWTEATVFVSSAGTTNWWEPMSSGSASQFYRVWCP